MMLPNPAAGGHNDPIAREQRTFDATETFRLLPYLALHTYDPIESKKRSSLVSTTSKCIPYHHATSRSSPADQSIQYLHALSPSRSPCYPICKVSVIPSDSLDAALTLGPPLTLPSPPATYRDVPRPTLLLNLANAQSPGGGWRNGALAQEESIMYRTTLASALPTRHCNLEKDFYAGRGWDANALFLHPCVVVVRESLADGHRLLPVHRPASLRMVSVLSCAAIRNPELERCLCKQGRTGIGFKRGQDRELTREKMRGILRVAGREGYARVVLGALGCGAFGGPSEEVVELWREVLQDAEWKGWFAEVVFAVLPGRGGDGNDNFSVFDMVLNRLTVGG